MVYTSQNTTGDEDDYYDDYFAEEGFDGYIETTNDPGPWAMVITVTICFLSMLSIPIMVILGERYEKRRRIASKQQCEVEDELLLKEEENARAAAAEKHQVALGPPRTIDRQATMKHDNRNEVSRNRLDLVCEDSIDEIEVKPSPRNTYNSATQLVSPTEKSVSFDTSIDIGNHSLDTSALRRSKRESPTKQYHVAKSEVSAGGASTMTSNTLTGFGNKITRVMDNVFIPQYPDDNEELRTKISYTRSKLSSVVSGTSSAAYSRSDAGSSLMGRSLNMLDAGAGATRRHRRGITRKPGGYQHMIRKCVDEEDRMEMKSAVSGSTGVPVSPLPSRTLAPSLDNGSSRTLLAQRRANRSQLQHRDDGSVATWDRTPAVDDISPNDAADAHDPGKELEFLAVDRTDQLDICCGHNALWNPAIWLRAFDGLVDVAEYDNEAQRILKLAIPFVTDAVMETILDNIDVALVANFVGTDAVSAYVVSDLFISMTDEFIGGIADAQGTLCPHALGAGNNTLCAQYVQIGVTIFVLVSAPLLVMWCFVMDDVLLWFGLSPDIARLGLQFTRVASIDYLLSGISESVIGLLEITDHEAWVAIVSLVFGVIDILAVALTVTMWDVELTTVAWVHLAVSVLYHLFTIIVATRKGWYRQFYQGLIGTLAIRNIPAVKHLAKAAVPLSIGSLLAYSEWEVLTFLAAYLGPAEVTTWALLGSLWETFEATTEGLGEAAAVRISLHLGKGRPEMARIACYKCLLMSVLFSLFITSILFMCGENLATWFTKDATLQNMLAKLIPLVGLGNVTMTFGMTAWHILGAQGRYRLATVVALICSWGITIPFATLSVRGLNLDLQGVVAAVVAGYSITGAVMACILLRSDWERLSNIIQDVNRLTGETYSDDSDEEDDASSKSSKSFVPESDESSDSSDDAEGPDKRKRISPGSVVSRAASRISRSSQASRKSRTSSRASSSFSRSILA